MTNHFLTIFKFIFVKETSIAFFTSLRKSSKNHMNHMCCKNVLKFVSFRFCGK